MTEYASFTEAMERLIEPMRRAHPLDERLDGQISGGNRRVVGIFWHVGRRWKIHADTHYEPLMLAYQALTSRLVGDPFQVQRTHATENSCLELVPELKRRLPHGPKHLYIYEVGPPK